jgi:hypothetical protein
MDESGQLHDPGALSPGKGTPGAPGSAWMLWNRGKCIVPAGSGNPAVQPVAIKLRYMYNRGIAVRFPEGVRDFHLLYSVKTGSGTHPASYRVGTGGSFHGDRTAGTWSWPLTSIWWRGQERMQLYLHLPIRLFAWGLIKHRDNLRWRPPLCALNVFCCTLSFIHTEPHGIQHLSSFSVGWYIEAGTPLAAIWFLRPRLHRLRVSLTDWMICKRNIPPECGIFLELLIFTQYSACNGIGSFKIDGYSQRFQTIKQFHFNIILSSVPKHLHVSVPPWVMQLPSMTSLYWEFLLFLFVVHLSIISYFHVYLYACAFVFHAIFKPVDRFPWIWVERCNSRNQ